MIKKKFSLFLLTAFLLVGISMPANAGTQKINIEMDGRAVKSDVAPYLQNGYTMVPTRVISESIGATVEYTAPHIKIVANDGKTITLTVGSKRASVKSGENEKELILEVMPKIKNDRTFVPLRFVAEALAVQVDYNAGKKTVVIATEPIILDGKAINSMTTHQYMTMGGWIYGYYGNANVAEFYRLLTAGIGSEVSAPEYFGRNLNLDCEHAYYLDTEFHFYHGMPQIDAEAGHEKDGLRNYTIYSHYSGWSKDVEEGYSEYLLLDEDADKWYLYDTAAWEKLHHFWDNIYGGTMSEELLNNVV